MPHDPTKPFADQDEDGFEGEYFALPGEAPSPGGAATSPFSGVASIWMILHGLKARLQETQDALANEHISSGTSAQLRADLQRVMLDVRDIVKPQGLMFRLRDFFGAADSYCYEHDAHLAENDVTLARLSLVRACDALGICLDRAMHLLEETAAAN